MQNLSLGNLFLLTNFQKLSTVANTISIVHLYCNLLAAGLRYIRTSISA